MAILTADQILNSHLKKVLLNVPEWGGDVFIKEPTGLERSEFELLTKNLNENDDIFKTIRGRCAVNCIVDAKGHKLFDDDQVNDLNSLSANALDRILDAYRDLSQMDDKDIEEAAKN